MKAAKSIALCVIVITQASKGQNNNHQFYVEGQICSGFQQSSFVTGAGGAFGFYISKNQSIDFRSRELYDIPDKKIISALSFNYRYHLKNGLFFGAGFGHHHEISQTYYIEQPVEATLGSEHNIMHRSGISFELGYNFKPFAKNGFFNRVYSTANLMAGYMIMDKGKNPLITANVGIRIGLKKW